MRKYFLPFRLGHCTHQDFPTKPFLFLVGYVFFVYVSLLTSWEASNQWNPSNHWTKILLRAANRLCVRSFLPLICCQIHCIGNFRYLRAAFHSWSLYWGLGISDMYFSYQKFSRFPNTKDTKFCIQFFCFSFPSTSKKRSSGLLKQNLW